jgi:phosphorylcholine metabolism protein LicD
MKKERATLTLSEMQDVLYDILKVFAEFCDKHGLRYYLFGGTLLGAVRHNGFIPVLSHGMMMSMFQCQDPTMKSL